MLMVHYDEDLCKYQYTTRLQSSRVVTTSSRNGRNLPFNTFIALHSLLSISIMLFVFKVMNTFKWQKSFASLHMVGQLYGYLLIYWVDMSKLFQVANVITWITSENTQPFLRLQQDDYACWGVPQNVSSNENTLEIRRTWGTPNLHLSVKQICKLAWRTKNTSARSAN